MRAVIFDIDGTICDVTHRRHHLETKPKNWKAFNEALHLDTPHAAIVELISRLMKDDERIILCSGREDTYEIRTKTIAWLSRNRVHYDRLYMRGEKDYRSDEIVKSELLDQILTDGYKPWLVIDDRDRVVKMWRARGLTCLQCAEGDF